MKKCSRCGIEKDVSEFSPHARYADGLNCWCKSCVREYAKITYTNKKDYYKTYGKDHELEHRRHNRTWHMNKRMRIEYRKTDCAKCGEQRRYVIDFHHIDPSIKKFSISTMALKYSGDILDNEIKKCVCLCRNCHKEFHYLYGTKPSEPVKALREYLGEKFDEIQLQ